MRLSISFHLYTTVAPVSTEDSDSDSVVSSLRESKERAYSSGGSMQNIICVFEVFFLNCVIIWHV